MTLREAVEAQNKLRAEIRTLMGSLKANTDGTVATEIRNKVDAMLADANTLKVDIERLEASAESEDRSLPSNRPPREGVESGERDERSQEERNRASNVALRSYLRNERFEQRDLTVAADGAVMIPTNALPPTLAQRSAGNIYDVVGHTRTTTGEPISFPLWDDTANTVVLDSTTIGNGTDPVQSGLTIRVDGLRTGDPLLVDNKLIQDLNYDLIGYVNLMMQERYTRGVSQLIQSGNGSSFTGLAGNIPATLHSEVAATLGYDDFVNLIATLDPAYHNGACFSFSNTVLGSVLKIKDSELRPIFIPYLDGATSGFVGQLLGFPVKINQYAPTVATGNVPVVFGDHAKGYQLREVLPGLVIKQSSQRWIELNRTGIVAFARAGGAPTLANTTTYSPLQALTIS
jgi:HK97 family phage major capsid protein